MARINLSSLDVVEIFHEIRSATGLFRDWREAGNDIVCSCPFHAAGRIQKTPSFGICIDKHDKSYGLCNCFSCGPKGSIINLINALHNKPTDDAFGIDFAQKVSDVEVVDERNMIQLRHRDDKPVTKVVSPYELIAYRQITSAYLSGRRIDKRIQDAFDCGFDAESQSVTFPVKRHDGAVLFIARRSVNHKWYNYPAGMKKPVYGLYELKKLAPGAKSVVVVESIINALTLWGLQIPAIALLGTGSRNQIELLNKTDIRQWILALDGDMAGLVATAKLKKSLKAHTMVMPIPSSYDVNDLDSYTINVLHCLRR